MTIDSNEKIAGFPILTIRKMFRDIGNYDNFDQRTVSLFLKKDGCPIVSLIEELESCGFIEKADITDGDQLWVTTLKGSAFTLSSASKRVKKNTAEKVLKEFLDRVNEVNQNDYYLHKIEKVLLFGSYLGDGEHFGDIDLAFDLAPRHKDKEKQSRLSQERALEARRNGRRFSNIVESISWSNREVFLYLKSRKRTLSFHPLWDIDLLNTDSKIIYPKIEER